jgi:formate dehydrogenase major subunit
VSGLGTSFGFGAASNHPRDLANSDCILIMGSNMAESHPVGFHWPVQAQQRGAVLIHGDPRYTRTSAVADVFVKIRAGTDIAFLCGIIHYILEHERYFNEYVVPYTNAATLIADEYRHKDDGGLFAGFNPMTGSYDLIPGAWEYACEARTDGARGLPHTDPTLRNPACVLQILKRHYARYTPQAVSRVCGCRPEDVIKVAELLCRNSGRDRTSAIAYALGWTQHSTGSQMIRAAAIIQLLLGNVGRPGGGVLALRGHACIQGATDIPVLFDMLPGYLPQPRAVPGHATLAQYLANGKSYLARRGDVPNGLWQEDVVRGAWSDMPKFAISLLKAWYGEAATRENDYRYTWVPKIDEDLSDAQPGWKDARWLGGYLTNSALMLGCAEMLVLSVLMKHARAAAILRPALGLLLVLNLIPLCLLAVDLRTTLSRIYTRWELCGVGALSLGGGVLIPLFLLCVVGSLLFTLSAVMFILLGNLVIRFVIVKLPHASA